MVLVEALIGAVSSQELAMSAIPLFIQRRFEQRWASRFTPPVPSNAPKNAVTKAASSTPTGRRTVRQRPKKNPPGWDGGFWSALSRYELRNPRLIKR
jgi:hypothetical protein